MLLDEWRALQVARDPTIAALAKNMADASTDPLVVQVLGYALATAGEDGLTELLPLLSHPTFWVRAYAAEGIGSLDNRARWAVPALVRALHGSTADWTAFTIIRALGNIGGHQALFVLERLGAEHRGRSPQDENLLQALEQALAAAKVQE